MTDSTEIPNTDQVTDSTAIPKTDKVTDSTAIPKTDEVTDSTAIPKTEQVTDSTAIPKTDQVTDSTAIPKTDEVTDSTPIPKTDQVTDSTAIPKTDRVTDSTAIPKTDQVTQNNKHITIVTEVDMPSRAATPLRGITIAHWKLFRHSRHERFNNFMVPRGWFIVSFVLMGCGLAILPFLLIHNHDGALLYSVYLLLCACVILFVMTTPTTIELCYKDIKYLLPLFKYRKVSRERQNILINYYRFAALLSKLLTWC